MKTIRSTTGALLLGALASASMLAGAQPVPAHTIQTPETTPTATTPQLTADEQAAVVAAAVEGSSTVLFEFLHNQENLSKRALLGRLQQMSAERTAGAIGTIETTADAQDAGERAGLFADAAKDGLMRAATTSLVGRKGITQSEVNTRIDRGVSRGVAMGAGRIGIDAGDVVIASYTR